MAEKRFSKSKLVFNPISSFIIFMINQLIARSVDQVTQTSPLWQKILYSDLLTLNFSNILVGLWFFTSIAHIYYDGRIKNKEQEIGRLEDELANAKLSLQHESSLLLSRYSDLAKFKKNDILFEVMKKFTDKNPVIYSSQIYKYTVKNGLTPQVWSHIPLFSLNHRITIFSA